MVKVIQGRDDRRAAVVRDLPGVEQAVSVRIVWLENVDGTLVILPRIKFAENGW